MFFCVRLQIFEARDWVTGEPYESTGADLVAKNTHVSPASPLTLPFRETLLMSGKHLNISLICVWQPQNQSKVEVNTHKKTWISLCTPWRQDEWAVAHTRPLWRASGHLADWHLCIGSCWWIICHLTFPPPPLHFLNFSSLSHKPNRALESQQLTHCLIRCHTTTTEQERERLVSNSASFSMKKRKVWEDSRF